MSNGEISTEENIAQSIVPYNRDDDRARYLGLRASGFKLREALRLIGKAKSTLSAWRHDPEFSALEDRIPELRGTLAIEYANLEFLRNYRLILEKDYRIITASLEKVKDGDGKLIPAILSSQDLQYLIKMRSHYTPQQLQIIEALLAVGGGQKGFDFTEFIFTLSRTKESLNIETRKRSESQLAPIVRDEE